MDERGLKYWPFEAEILTPDNWTICEQQNINNLRKILLYFGLIDEGLNASDNK